jgi:multiple sugar transport system ATP-binding protein
MATIYLENVVKRYGDVLAVDNLSLEIKDGSFTTLLGPSGCGKTTTLRMIAGLEEPTSGTIKTDHQVFYSSQDGLFLPPGKRNLGLVFQSYALWPHMTVWDNIAFGLKVKKMDPGSIKKTITHISELLQIEQLLQRYPSELSGGQQQRVALARVLASKPEILLLDEPLSNLDAKLRMDMRAELKRLHHETGATVIYVTHDQLEALTMSTMVAVMNEGIVRQYAPPLDIYFNPADTFVADFVGNPKINLIPAKLQAQDGQTHIDMGFLRLRVQDNPYPGVENIVAGIRPEHIKLSRVSQASPSTFQVFSILPAGAETYVRIVRDNLYLTVRIDGLTDLKSDELVKVTFDLDLVRVFEQKSGNRLSLSIANAVLEGHVG